MENLHSVQSESDEDISPRQKIFHVSSDSDLASHDISSRHGKELDSGRLHNNDTFIT